MSRHVMRRAAELARRPDVEAEAQSALARLRQGRRLTGEGNLPGGGEPFAWRLLNGAEKDQAISAAVKRMGDLGLPVELRMYNDLENHLAWQVLALAMRDPEQPGTATSPLPVPFAKDADELRELLTDDERDILYVDYLDFQSSVDPDPAELAPEIYAAIDEAVKKKQLVDLLSFGSRMLASYLVTTGSPSSTSLNGKSGNLPPSGMPAE